MSYGVRLQQAKDEIAATTATDRVLVAATPGVTTQVAYLFISADADVTVTFESATNHRFTMYVPARGGVTAPSPGDGQYLFSTAEGEALTWTTAGVASVFVSALIRKE